MATSSLSDPPVSTNGNGSRRNGTSAEVDEAARKWAASTNDPRALSLYNFYVSELKFAPDQARFWAEDSIRIKKEVEREFST